MTRFEILRITFGIAVLSMFVGCKSPGYGFVQKEWSENMRQLGITPIFPPREDVFVGDIYVSSYDPESTETRKLFEIPWTKATEEQRNARLLIGASPRLGRLPLNQKISNEYANAISVPPSTSNLNQILGNPSLAAANDLVTSTTDALSVLKKKISDLDDIKSAAEKALTTAIQLKTKADAAFQAAQDDLTNVKTPAGSTAAEQTKVQLARENLRLAENELADAQFELDGDDSDVNKEAVREKQRDQTRAQTELERAKEDLTLKQAEALNIERASKEAAVEAKRIAAREAAVEVSEKTNERDAAVLELQEKTTENESKISAAESKVEEAKTLRNAIATVGGKSLYPQSQYPKHNIFTGEELGEPDGSAKNSRVNRLRIVGFPDFSTTSVTQGDLAALVPVEALATGLNISSSNVDKVTVKIPAAESYGLSFSEVYPEVFGDPITVGTKNYWVLENSFSTKYVMPAMLQVGYKSDNNHATDESLFFRVVTEVYYARAIDVSIFSSRSFGVNLGVGDPVESDESEQDAGDADANTESDEKLRIPGSVNSIVPGDSATTALLRQIQDNIDRSEFLPGGSIQVVSYNNSSIGLRMVYDRPIAVGVRGITFQYAPCKQKSANAECQGVVLSSSIVSSVVPLAR